MLSSSTSAPRASWNVMTRGSRSPPSSTCWSRRRLPLSSTRSSRGSDGWSFTARLREKAGSPRRMQSGSSRLQSWSRLRGAFAAFRPSRSTSHKRVQILPGAQRTRAKSSQTPTASRGSGFSRAKAPSTQGAVATTTSSPDGGCATSSSSTSAAWSPFFVVFVVRAKTRGGTVVCEYMVFVKSSKAEAFQACSALGTSCSPQRSAWTFAGNFFAASLTASSPPTTSTMAADGQATKPSCHQAPGPASSRRSRSAASPGKSTSPDGSSGLAATKKPGAVASWASQKKATTRPKPSSGAFLPGLLIS
mmetsp:Transcript_29613/g.96852  ORF Transcript_29613/g.96852 Transcript_29613/m.96852 type:complete len:305 (-) Transcript_29613:706-1620(-)